jgi:hypothetical protein
MKPKISFDFDGTLETKEMQEFAKELIAKGYDICILTTRYSDPTNYQWAKSNPERASHLHDELFAIAKELGITEINFTEYKWKTGFVDELGIDIHIDDNYRDEVFVINYKNRAKAVEFCSWTPQATREEVYALIDSYISQITMT